MTDIRHYCKTNGVIRRHGYITIVVSVLYHSRNTFFIIYWLKRIFYNVLFMHMLIFVKFFVPVVIASSGERIVVMTEAVTVTCVMNTVDATTAVCLEVGLVAVGQDMAVCDQAPQGAATAEVSGSQSVIYCR